jgi:kynureninase
MDLAREKGFKPRTPEQPERRGGMVILEFEEGAAVTRELLRREVIVDHRPGAGIRFSPHFYTSDQELVQAIDTLAEIVHSGAHRAHIQAGGTGF